MAAWWRSCVLGLVGLLLAGCAAHAPSTGAPMRVELVARLEDGRLLKWELLEVRRTCEGTGGVSRPLSSEVAGHSIQVLLPFTEGLSEGPSQPDS
jgi:hypothetical protein